MFVVEDDESPVSAGYRNPVLPGCHPDPSVCRVGDEFFLVTSTFEHLPGLPVHRSRDLVNWDLIGHVVHDELDLSGVPSSGGLFAPTIRHHDGRFFVVCTLVHGTGRQGHFLMTASDAAGPWTGPVWFDDVAGIDPSLTFDGERVWLCGTRLAEPGDWPQQTEVWLRELDPRTFAALPDEHVIWHGALEGAVWAEGPHILPRPGGGWMLLASEGGTDRDHAVAVAYADEITGPYVGDPANPRLTHRDLGERSEIVGVGHADLVDAPDGTSWSLLLGTRLRDGAASLLGRQTHLVPVAWEDRRPLFAPGDGRVRTEVAVAPLAPQRPEPSILHDGFAGATLDPQWNGVRHVPSTFARLEDGRLRLSGTQALPGTTEPGAEPLAFLGRRLPDDRVAVRMHLARPASGIAGILLRTSDTAYLQFAVGSDTGPTVTLAADGRTRTVDPDAAPASLTSGRSGDDVILELRLEGFTTVLSAAGHRWTVDVRGLSPDRAGGFVGAWIGPFAVGTEVVVQEFVLRRG